MLKNDMFNMQWISIYSYEGVRYSTSYLCLLFGAVTFPTWATPTYSDVIYYVMILSKVSNLQV